MALNIKITVSWVVMLCGSVNWLPPFWKNLLPQSFSILKL